MLRFNDQERVLSLGVHDLIDAGPRHGDLRLQVAWSARARMRAGQEVHTAWQGHRAQEDDAFQREVTVRHSFMVRDWEVRISGRLDGLSREGETEVVEEIKSTTLPTPRLLERGSEDFPSWTRQVHLYLWFLQEARRPAIGRLVLISLLDGGRHIIPVDPSPEIRVWVETQLDWIIHQHEKRQAWLARRRQAKVPFAHPSFREGQEGLAQEVEDSLAQGCHLLLGAPTGYGKTAAVLHAALRHAYQTDRRVFFATARTTQQLIAAEVAQQVASQGLPIRAVQIRAREKVCLNEVVLCRADSCPYAADYHEKVRQGELLDRLWDGAGGVPGAPSVEEVVSLASEHTACPFALTLDGVEQADLVIGDFNYLFDPSVRLSLIDDRLSEWVVIVDEAHNLPERAMGYGSPEVLLTHADQSVDLLMDRLDFARVRPFVELAEDTSEWLRSGVARIPATARDGEAAFELSEGLDRRTVRELAERFDGLAIDYALLSYTDPLVDRGQQDPWLELARSVLRLRSALERGGEETVALWRKDRHFGRSRREPRQQLSLVAGSSRSAGFEDRNTGLRLLCRDPSALLRPVMDGLDSVVCMSATLTPTDFYARLLGLDSDRTAILSRPSPFPPENRAVLVVPSVSTQYRHRERDREATASLINDSIAAIPGNLAIFFPSFAFLEATEPLLELGARPLLKQQRGMSEEARLELLDTMREGAGHVLLAVLGGIFSEGVDLPGSALTGAIVVGPALPQANLSRRLLQDWYQQQYEQGFRYAWLVPGMSRVVQAAGRVVRSSEDLGSVVLVGKRFLQRDYQAFFPEEWVVEKTTRPGDVLEGFWVEQVAES